MSLEESLSVQYTLTRGEVLRSFLRSVAESPKYRRTMILYSFVIGVSTLLIRVTPLRSATVKDALVALAVSVGILVFIPLWIFVRAKTAQRILTISRDGISTEIGRLRGQIPWDKVKIVKETPQFVLISRSNGNAFFIPQRAFSGSEHQRRFVSALTDWMRAHTDEQTA